MAVRHALHLQLQDRVGQREVELVVVRESSPERWSSTDPPPGPPPEQAIEDPTWLEPVDLPEDAVGRSLDHEPSPACAQLHSVAWELDERGPAGPYATSLEALAGALSVAPELPRAGWDYYEPRFTPERFWYLLQGSEGYRAGVVTTKTLDGWFALASNSCPPNAKSSDQHDP